MTINVNKRSRGRPRQFGLEDAIQVGQHLFHERGYENVSVASLTEAIGITAPSFYTAFGSKSAFFCDALRHYSATVVPLDALLIPGTPPQIALLNMLKAAAHAYAEHPQRRGCFILEHAKAGATESGAAAKQIAEENRARVMAFLEGSGISAASQVVDYVSVTMLGLSAAAKEGWEEERLIAIVDTAAVGLGQLIASAQAASEASA
nr:TetR/AcrR family transcriptional regulator [uncultured Pseudomonas sp.]